MSTCTINSFSKFSYLSITKVWELYILIKSNDLKVSEIFLILSLLFFVISNPRFLIFLEIDLEKRNISITDDINTDVPRNGS